MAGMVREPMAATVAGPEPEMAAKNIEVPMAARAIPPGKEPSSSSARFKRRLESPPAPMKTPAAIKNGMAMIGKLSIEVKAICEMYSVGRVPAFKMVAVPARPRLTEIGTPMTKKSRK